MTHSGPISLWYRDTAYAGDMTRAIQYLYTIKPLRDAVLAFPETPRYGSVWPVQLTREPSYTYLLLQIVSRSRLERLTSIFSFHLAVTELLQRTFLEMIRSEGGTLCLSGNITSAFMPKLLDGRIYPSLKMFGTQYFLCHVSRSEAMISPRRSKRSL